MRFTGTIHKTNDVVLISSLLTGSAIAEVLAVQDDYKSSIEKLKSAVPGEFKHIWIFVESKNIIFERVKFQQGYNSYNSVIINNFVIWDIVKLNEITIELDEIISDAVYEVTLVVSESKSDNRIEIKHMNDSVENPVNDIALKICTEGPLSEERMGFKFVDLNGKVISQRSKSVMLFSTLENFVSFFLNKNNGIDLDIAYTHICSVVEKMIKSLKAFVELSENPNNLKYLRAVDSKYCLLLRPVTHLALFELFYKYEGTPAEKQLIKILNELDFSISEKWVGIILSENQVVVSKSKEHLIAFIESKIK